MSGSHSSSGRADPAQEIFAMSDPMRGQGLLRAVKRLRRVATWLVALAACAVLAVSASAWPEDGIVDILMGDIGLILLLVCAFGRLWSSLYIAGFKNDKLITVGPYSLVRNPLYVFSFCGAVGLGLASGSFIITGLLIVPFLVWYPVLVLEEERVLAERHPEEWAAYADATPRFISALRRPTVPETYTINSRRVGHAFADAIWFPMSYIALQGIETLHRTGFLHAYWHII